MASPRDVAGRGPAPGAGGRSWVRGVAAAFLFGVGLCEMLVTSPWIDSDWAPPWLWAPVVIVGYVAFLVLAGLTSLVGNLVVGALVLGLTWRDWGWPLWRAAPIAAPYWIAFYQIVPKPW